MFKKHLLSLAIISLSSSSVLAANFNPNPSGGGTFSAPLANDDFDSVIVGLKPAATGIVTSNDLNGDFVVLNSSPTGTYGFLTLTSTGGYTYTLYDNAVNAALFPGETVTDTFDYIYTKNPTTSFTSTTSVSASLHIRVTGGQDSLSASDDFVPFVVNKDSEITGDVTINDINGASVRLNSTPVSAYGIVDLNSDGTFSYKLHEKPPAEITDLKTGELITDEFEYIYLNKFEQEVTAKLVVQIVGNFIEEDKKEEPILLDLTLSIIVNKFDDAGKLIVGYTGKVTVAGGGEITSNVLLKSSPVSDYGYLLLNSNGDFEYTYYKNSPKILALTASDVVTDTFEYIYLDADNQVRTSKLNVQIIGNPVDANGDTRFAFAGGDNVDVEFNNSASQATPLNSGRNIRGHIQQTGDQDWYSLSSSGNEIITLEMCPKGSECFREAMLKHWVLYVFDSAKFTPQMENSTVELSNAFRLSSHTSSLYARYRAGLFDGALVGIIDPCFGDNNTVNIGVGEGERNYLVAISTPLQGSTTSETGENKPVEECGVGSVFLSQLVTEERQVEVGNFSPPVFESTTVSGLNEYIIYSPYSDDQYTIQVSGTGVHPLLSPIAEEKSSTFSFDTGELSIPKIRVSNDLFQVDLNLQSSLARSSGKDDILKFDLSAINLLGNEASDSYQATYNPANNEVLIPRVTDINSGKAYSVVLKYHAATESAEQVLELIDVKEIK